MHNCPHKLTQTTRQLLSKLSSVFPVLKTTAHKGQNGRIAVIGGSFEFTGAPYYSAISSLRVGGDMAHIFCSKNSSPSIKSYSPEIIVHPVFLSEEEVKFVSEDIKGVTEQWFRKIKNWQQAIHSWVIGPGLGRDPYMHQFFPTLVRGLPQNCLVVFDADGIYYLCQHPQLLKQLGRFRTILTPNLRQLSFLQKHLNIDIQSILKQRIQGIEIQQIIGSYEGYNCTIVIKGEVDVILGKNMAYLVQTEGGLKRCGGIGDVLAGSIAVCSLWDYQLGPILAARIVRMATRRAFKKQGRGLTAPFVIAQLSGVVRDLQLQLASQLLTKQSSNNPNPLSSQ